MKILVGKRNRMVHYYHEITVKEHFEICPLKIDDIALVADVLRKWINNHPDMIDKTI